MTDKKITWLGALSQTSIDFENIVHRRENSAKNEKHLNGNRYHFTGQALIVFTWLQKGLKVTSMFASQNNITDLQRRIGDLGEFGEVDIDRDYLVKEDGKKSRMLVYFLPENRRQFIDKKIIPDNKRWWYSELYTPSEIIAAIRSSK